MADIIPLDPGQPGVKVAAQLRGGDRTGGQQPGQQVKRLDTSGVHHTADERFDLLKSLGDEVASEHCPRPDNEAASGIDIGNPKYQSTALAGLSARGVNGLGDATDPLVAIRVDANLGRLPPPPVSTLVVCVLVDAGWAVGRCLPLDLPVRLHCVRHGSVAGMRHNCLHVLHERRVPGLPLAPVRCRVVVDPRPRVRPRGFRNEKPRRVGDLIGIWHCPAPVAGSVDGVHAVSAAGAMLRRQEAHPLVCQRPGKRQAAWRAEHSHPPEAPRPELPASPASRSSPHLRPSGAAAAPSAR